MEAPKASVDVKLQCRQISKITSDVIHMVGAVKVLDQGHLNESKFEKIKKNQQLVTSLDADDDSFNDAA